MAFSTHERDRIIGEAFSGKTSLVCKRHMYSPGGIKPPTSDCSDCWFAFYFHNLAQLSPSKRQEKLDELELVVNMAAEAEDHGNFNPDIYRHPIVKIEKGAEN